MNNQITIFLSVLEKYRLLTMILYDLYNLVLNSFKKTLILTEDLVPIPSESEDTDDDSLPEEDVQEENLKIYSNPLFEFDDKYISSDVNPLFDEVLEDIKNKESYEPALLVTPLSDATEDECFDLDSDVDEIELLLHHNPSTPKISVAYILEGFTDEPPLKENDDLFDLESKENEWKTILYDAPIDDLMTEDKVFDPGISEKFFSLTRIAIIFPPHMLSEFFFLISPIWWNLLFFSPLGVRILFLTPVSSLFIFLLENRWHLIEVELLRASVIARIMKTLVTDISQKDKNKAKRTKPSTGMEKAWEIEAEGIFNFNGPTRRGIRKKGLYVMNLGNEPKDKTCLATIDENSMLWHRRLDHANMHLIQSLASKELVRNLPKLKFDQHFCDACKIGKQAHASHKAKNIVSTTRFLELLHMDLFGPSAVWSYEGNRYTLVIVDDYSREFDNEVQSGEFCNANGITHNFSNPRTPQSNGVVERKNRILQEISRTMLIEQLLPQKFWCNTVDTSTYILNWILIRAILGKTPYELLRGRKPTLDYFRVFGRKCFIINTKDYLTKFDPKSYEGIFLGYSQNSKAYIILNKHTRKVKESLNVTFDETPPSSKTPPLVDDDLDEEEAIKITKKKNIESDIVDETLKIDKIVNIKESRNNPLENVIGNLNQRTLRSQAQNQSNFFCFISTIEPKNVNETLTDDSWIVTMQEELNQFIANDVWELVLLETRKVSVTSKVVIVLARS
ncbi:retrovirus-related pol polyprotein from transposon TNT 1-94 [Tanacetum coccineum]